MAIDTQHPLYILNKPFWDKCQDAFDGEDTIKAKGQTYLPKLSGQTDTEYAAYVARGMFYGATEKTIKSLVGMLLHKKPVIKVPSKIDYVIDDITGTGLSLNEFIKQIAKEILLTGRYGVLLDRDSTDTENNRVNAIGYTAQEVTNWIDSIDGLDAVILDASAYEETDEKYLLELKSKLKEISFNESGGVQVSMHTKSSKGWDEGEAVDLLNTGNALDKIPFTFINTVGVSSDIEKPPFLDLVNTVLAHWKNSVDLEHGRHFCAIPTAWITGGGFGNTTVKPTVDGVVQETPTYHVGGENAWLLPEKANVGYLEFSGQGLAAIEKGLEHKEKVIALIGSRILQNQKKAAETAETTRINAIGDSVTLSSIAIAVEAGIKNVLQNVAEWENVDPDLVEVEFNNDFIDAKIDPAMIKVLLDSYLQDAISLETFLYNMNSGEILPDNISVEDEKNKVDLQAANKGLGEFTNDDDNEGEGE